MTRLSPHFRVRYSVTLLLILLASAQNLTPLRSAAERIPILIGTAVRPSLFSEVPYSETLAREFNMIEPEDAMKWSVIRHERGFDFREGDEVVRFAQAHGMKVRGHCLVWDHDNPRWLTAGHFTQAQLSDLLHEHITTVMKHYAGQVLAWDVVNEALNEKGDAKDSIWYNTPGIGMSGKGTAYVEQAFRWAHEAESHTPLFYNEAEGEGLNAKSEAVYAMVRDFKQRGVPIDGVGLQMHITPEFDTDALATNINRLRKLGVQVHITELDVSLALKPDGTIADTDLERQADVYRRVLQTCLAHSGCTAFQTWGFTDKWSWIGSHSRGTHGAALLFDRSYKPKPAYDAVLSVLRSVPQKVN
jgi:endo-1,4-beta-xylanase